MYVALLVILLIPVWFLVRTGRRRHNVFLLAAGAAWAVSVVLFFLLLDFWGEMLWFAALGFQGRFWTEMLAKAVFAVCGASFAGLVIFLMAGSGKTVPRAALLLGVFLGGRWGVAYWQEILLFFHRVDTSLREPVFGRQTGFYLFSLPLYDGLFQLALLSVCLGLAAQLASSLFLTTDEAGVVRMRRKNQGQGLGESPGPRRLYRNSAALFFVLAAGAWLLRYHLLYSQWGTVNGAGWTDVHVRLPAYAALSLLLAAAGCWLLFLALGRLRLEERLPRRLPGQFVPVAMICGSGALAGLAWLLLLVLLPGLLQWLQVEPNEITYEKPYIEQNIHFTRHGYGLHRVEEREFPARGAFTREIVADNSGLLNNIRLWDKGALDAVYRQFQEIRLYYEFVGVDVDRYSVGGDYRQVMVSAREMEPANLPKQSRTFVNKRFKYTHGYGITMAPVSEFTPEGLPNLLIRDIPPRSDYPELAIERPQIYYGELTDDPVVVNTSEGEFDYPRGEGNVYLHYPGSGGVVLSSLWRRFLFGWKFDGTRFFLSDYPTPQSRILFHRQVRERVAAVAPFLHFDADPYIVLHDGRLSWIIDAYTTSAYYPYSEPFSAREKIEETVPAGQVSRGLHGVNYIRNSVKAVVDAFDGTVRFYVFDSDDPLITAWRRVFPELFQDREAMEQALAAHVRYPKDLLLVQGLVYAKYHMTDPRVFYNQEDLWIRATEKYYNQVEPLHPYYVMWKIPGADQLEFALILPFTPKNRQVLIGWIAGLCDRENYGRFLVYKFPKERRILGTQQVETKIDQDRFLSAQLSLWNQRGSQVIRGNVLAIPIADTILYVEPIYLRAETAAYPELRLVVLMHDDRMVYAPSFAEALAKLLGEVEEVAAAEPGLPWLQQTERPELLRQANDALQRYLAETGSGRFEEAAGSLRRLQELLRQLLEQAGENVR
ncbi:MAG: UPF0182 family protein [Thermodesulfobacteriota bacterium]